MKEPLPPPRLTPGRGIVAGVAPRVQLRSDDDGRRLWLPAFATAHSHAFQRGLRGRAQRRGADPSDDFWTWRGEMYRLAQGLTPESLHRLARMAFRELFRAGVRTVGEFHYVHHQPGGKPYAERTLLSELMIDAAKCERLRICLLRCIYHRGGPGREAEPGQVRFCDPTLDHALRDVEALLSKYTGDPDVRIGLAPHSVRAIPPDWWRPLAEFARLHGLWVHAHVAEQPREADECLAETGRRPGEFLAEAGVLSERFVAVHGTQLTASEARLLGDASATVCLCPTTERDLGDGLAPISELREAGVRLCTGIDSHVVTDPFEDMRSIETHERLRTGKRVTYQPHDATPAEDLWAAASLEGARVCGFDDAGGDVILDGAHPLLELVDEDQRLDAIVFSGTTSLVQAVVPWAPGGRGP